MITVNSLNSGHCRDLELVSSLARVQNKRELSSIKRLYSVFARDLAAVGGVHYSEVSARCELTVLTKDISKRWVL